MNLFIGLGGVGTGVLDHLYDKMHAYNQDLARQRQPQVDAYYYYIDTENRRHNENPAEFMGGNKSDHTPANPFFGDKIVKLIIKNGYKIDDYHYFNDYKEYANVMLRVGEHHDPFIDKRFLGKPDANGKYPCNVGDALRNL